MYLMYVDESGDCGKPSDNSPCRYFCLTGVVVHELDWRGAMTDLLSFRRWLKGRYGIPLDAEIHAANMIAKLKSVHPSLQALKKYERLAVIRHFADALAGIPVLRVVSVVVDKHGAVPDKGEVFRWAWYSLFQRFENTIRRKNFPGPNGQQECGIVFPDDTDGGKLTRFLTHMRVNNFLRVPDAGRHIVVNQPIQWLIEDPLMRDSRQSYLIQAADCTAFLLKQLVDPSAFMRKHGGNAYFGRLQPIVCKQASFKDASGMGIVRL